MDFEIIRQPTTVWEFDNPTLLANCLGVCSDIRNGVETDTGLAKLGNGVDDWDTLGYFNPDGGQAVWGEITGTLSSQTDLTTAFGTQGIKRYRALLTQSGTSAPAATVLENSLGGTVVWTRDDVGSYFGTLSGAFTADKTWFSLLWAGGVDETGKARLQRGTADTVALETGTGIALTDDWGPMSVEILVYP